MRGLSVWTAEAEPSWANWGEADVADDAGRADDRAGCGAVVARDFRGLTVTVSLKPIWAKMVLSGW